MRLAIPLGFHDDTAYLDNAVMGEGIVEVLNGRRVQFVSFAVRMLVVEAGKLGVVVADAISRGFHQPSALDIEGLHLGVNGILRRCHLLLARSGEEHYKEYKG